MSQGLTLGEMFVGLLVTKVVSYGAVSVGFLLEEAVSQILVCINGNVIVMVAKEAGHLESYGGEI